MQEELYEIENHGEFGTKANIWQRLIQITVIRNHKKIDVSLEDLVIGEQGEAVFSWDGAGPQYLNVKRIK